MQKGVDYYGTDFLSHFLLLSNTVPVQALLDLLGTGYLANVFFMFFMTLYFWVSMKLSKVTLKEKIKLLHSQIPVF
jgi:hypothetical protein